MDGWLFGIDGGGTSSRLRVESMAGKVLFEGKSGSTNLDSNGEAVVSEVLRALIGGALAAGLDPSACRAGFIGSAGVDTDEDRPRMVAIVRDAFVAAARAEADCGNRSGGKGLPTFGAGNDSEPALVGALGDTEGFLLIAGTGSIALGRTRSGRYERAGGWGHFLGDEGSAFWMGFEAIKRGIRSSEGRDSPSGLLEAALTCFGLADARSLIPFTYWKFDKALIASFAQRVAAMAEEGDAVAEELVDRAIVELAALVASVYGRLARDIQRPRLALYGGLLENNPRIRAAVSDRIATTLPGLEIVEAAGDAQAGACRLARELVALPSSSFRKGS